MERWKEGGKKREEWREGGRLWLMSSEIYSVADLPPQLLVQSQTCKKYSRRAADIGSVMTYTMIYIRDDAP